VTDDIKQTILITGATGAIGGALARYYAKPGVKLLLQGRNQEKLTDIAEQCRDVGAEVDSFVLDLTDNLKLTEWLTYCVKTCLPDLVYANAGMNTHIGEEYPYESWQQVETLLDLNIKSTFALVNQLIPAMYIRKSGQIVLISSLAGFYGLPVTPSYSASKAAIKTYGEALRGGLARAGIKVNVVMPGYISSDMCDAMPGPKPFLWTPQRAVETIAMGVQKNKARITFPFPLNIGTWLLSVLPPAWSQRILIILGYRG
jgi:short-subunit dehydrogenase